MSKLDDKVEKLFGLWFDLLIPEDSTTADLNYLEAKTNLSFHLLHKIKKRKVKVISGDSLVKIAFARGFTSEQLEDTFTDPKKPPKKVSKTQNKWIRLGEKLTDLEKENIIQSISLLKSAK